ncbi:FkbM family methyltransferase [Campylobacter molothri]|uniref:FkbM family methyltransferase n=1 Tax=Campylobacter molothri TaxID=1032242 RepID=UPI00301C65DB
MNFIDKKDNIVAFYFFKLPWFKKIKNIHANIYGIGEYVSYSLFFLNFHLWTTKKNLELTNPEFLSKKLEKLLNQFNQKQWKQNFYMQDILGKYLIENNIHEKILKLCENLDNNSKTIIFRILTRLKNFQINANYQIKYTKEEKQDLERLETEFFPNILSISKGIFGWNGYFLPIKQFEISVFWHKHAMHNFSNKTLENIRNKNIIDVGGFIGDSAIVFEKEFTDKKIYSFEAVSKNYDLMLKTLELNNSKRIIPIKNALGSKQEKLQISISGYSSSLKYDEINSNHEEVEVITLDSYIEKNPMEIGFIKIDIEGFEQECLKGAINTIKTQKPAMLISIYHNPDDFFNIKPLIESWNLGYKFKIYRPIDFYISLETALYCEIDK